MTQALAEPIPSGDFSVEVFEHGRWEKVEDACPWQDALYIASMFAEWRGEDSVRIEPT